jgi:hypothetical protein
MSANGINDLSSPYSVQEAVDRLRALSLGRRTLQSTLASAASLDFIPTAVARFYDLLKEEFARLKAALARKATFHEDRVH